jgi:hypothetical protein
MSSRITVTNEMAKIALFSANTYYEKLGQLSKDANTIRGITTVPPQIADVEKELSTIEKYALPSETDQQNLQNRIANCRRLIAELQSSLLLRKDIEAWSLKIDVETFATRSSFSAIAPDKIPEAIEGFEKRIAELEPGGYHETLDKTKNYIQQNKERLIASGKPRLTQTSSSSSSSSTSFSDLASEFAKLGIVVSFAAKKNEKASASMSICTHFLKEALCNHWVVKNYLNEIIDKGGDSLPAELVPHKLKDQFDFCAVEFKNDREPAFHQALTDLDRDRAAAKYNRIGAVIISHAEYTAVAITQSGDRCCVQIFNPNGNPKALKGVTKAFYMSFDSLEKAASLLAKLYQEENSFEMHMYASKRDASHRSSRSSSASSSSSTHSSMLAPVQAEPVVAPSLPDMANKIDELLNDLMKKKLSLPNAVERLIGLNAQFGISIGNGDEEIWEEMPVSGVILYHLTMILLEKSPSNPHIIKDPEYAIKALENRDGCTATRDDFIRALLRAKMDILMRVYYNVVKDENSQLVDKYGLIIRGQASALAAFNDSIPELEKFESRGNKYANFIYVNKTYEKLKKQWNLM